MFLLKVLTAVTPVRLEPAALRSRFKHSTTEPLRSPPIVVLFIICQRKKIPLVIATKTTCLLGMESSIVKRYNDFIVIFNCLRLIGELRTRHLFPFNQSPILIFQIPATYLRNLYMNAAIYFAVLRVSPM